MKKRGMVLFAVLFTAAMILAYSCPSLLNAAEYSDSRIEEEIRALKKEVLELRKDVDELKNKDVVKPQPRQPESPEVTVSMDDDPMKGAIEAPVTIIEFSDYQCPFCGRFSKMTLPEIERDYISTGKVRYVFRDYPLEFHKQAPKASEAANCAGEQGKYWEMHDKIFENQNALAVDRLKQYAADIGLESNAFDFCLDSGKYAGEVMQDLNDGRKAGVSGTPCFIIGRSNEGSKEISGKRVVGARPYTYFKQIIDELLAEE